MGNYREFIKDKKRIVIKIGSSSLMHEQTGRLDLLKIEKLVRILIDIKNSGKDVVLVSSGAIAVGRAVIGLCDRPTELPVKQACASIGQAKLMMVYQKIFAEYGAVASQVLLTKNTIVNDVNRTNAQNTFNEILKLGAVPIVNENDTVSTYEIEQLTRVSALNSYRLLEIMTDFQQLLLQLSERTFLFCYLILMVCIQMIQTLILMLNLLKLYTRLMRSLWEWVKIHPAVIWGLAE